MLVGRIAGALALALALCACQEPKETGNVVTGGGPVRVVSVTFIASQDSGTSLGAGAATYILAKVELSNTTNQTLYPQASKFYLLDQDDNRWAGMDTGSAVFAGISNSLAPLAPGERRTYIVGFRALATTQGTIVYDY